MSRSCAHDAGRAQPDRTYTPAAQHLAVPPVQVGADGRFVSEYTLDAGAAPGLYHILVWVETAAAAERVPALDAVIEVQP